MIIPKKRKIPAMIREVIIPYGSEMKSVKLDGISRTVVARGEASAKLVSPDVLIRSVENPVGKPPLRRFLEGSKQLVVIVNDATRRTPTAQILESISPYLEKTAFTLLVACGAHPEPTSSELKRILGKNHQTLKPKTVFHVSKCSKDMVHLGRSSRGTDFHINHLAVDADQWKMSLKKIALNEIKKVQPVAPVAPVAKEAK